MIDPLNPNPLIAIGSYCCCLLLLLLLIILVVPLKLFSRNLLVNEKFDFNDIFIILESPIPLPIIPDEAGSLIPEIELTVLSS